MSPLISRATDNLGLIFSLQLGGAGGGGPVPVQDFVYDIELFGEGFANSFVDNDSQWGPGDGNSSPSQSLVINNGGGYTKLRMKSLTSSDISFEPQLYLGGRCITTSTFFKTVTYTNPTDGQGGTSSGTTNVDRKAAGDAAAFSIDGEWMGIAGGGSLSYYIYKETTRGDGNINNTLFSAEILGLVPASGLPEDGGQGGFNLDNPSASPQNGANLTNPVVERTNSSQTFTTGVDGFDGTRLDEKNVGGAGGAGAGPGLSRDSTTLTPSTGGGGNVRIWADTAGVGGIAAGKLNGNIDSVPGTEMNVVDGRNGTEIGESRVAITATNTGLGIAYTTNNTLSLRELKALLDPELEFAFDVELYGEGLGDIGLSNSGDVGPGFTVGPVPSNSLRGGYTKLRMIAPSSASSISFLPQTYSGGVVTVTGPNIPADPVTGATTYSLDGASGLNEAFNGGAGAAFSIDGEWMGIAGGSGVVRYAADQTVVSGSTTREITIDPTDFPIVPGRGGVNSGNPTASPGRGGDVLSADNPVIFFAGTQSAIQIFGGAGGGGAGGGPAATPGVSAAEGGGGNIRVYAESDGTFDTGDITLPGLDPIYMRLENSRDNFWLGASKVVVSHPVTGVSLEFTSDTTISIRELRALLIPTQEVVFEVELFGAGLGVVPITSSGTDEFRPAPLPNSNTTVRTNVDYLAGGYTKLKMFVPVSDTNTISFEPALYLGGKQDSGSTSPGDPGGQNASAFSVDGEWMGIAGGGGDGRHSVTVTRDISTDADGFITLDRSIYSGFSFNNATVPGKGGVNVGNPTASPQNGGDYRETFDTTFGTGGRSTSSGSTGGGGGGGASGGIGRGASPVGPGDGGEGNIRIYAETNGAQTKGDLTSVPGVYMELLDSADDFWVGGSKVTIKNILNGDISTFNTNRTFTTKELREIFYPGVFPPA